MWNFQPSNCSGLPSLRLGETCSSCTHTQPVLLGNLQFAFESDHPLQFGAAVHVKTALNSSRNCWCTSGDVSPPAPCLIPQGRTVLLPSSSQGLEGKKPMALCTSHLPLVTTLPTCQFFCMYNHVHTSVLCFLSKAVICPSLCTSCACSANWLLNHLPPPALLWSCVHKASSALWCTKVSVFVHTASSQLRLCLPVYAWCKALHMHNDMQTPLHGHSPPPIIAHSHSFVIFFQNWAPGMAVSSLALCEAPVWPCSLCRDCCSAGQHWAEFGLLWLWGTQSTSPLKAESLVALADVQGRTTEAMLSSMCWAAQAWLRSLRGAEHPLIGAQVAPVSEGNKGSTGTACWEQLGSQSGKKRALYSQELFFKM